MGNILNPNESLDVSVRIYGTQMEKEFRPSSPKLTNEFDTKSFAADSIQANNIATALAELDKGIITLQVDIPHINPAIPATRHLVISNATGSTKIEFVTYGGNHEFAIEISHGGNFITALNLGMTNIGKNQIAFGIDTDGVITASRNGNIPVSNPSPLVNLPIFTKANIGSSTTDIVYSPSTYHSLAVLDEAPTNLQLQRLSTL